MISMETYAYLFLDLLLFIPWLVIFTMRKDLRRKMIKGGIFGGIAGPIAEFWFHKDYWLPPVIIHSAVSIEDILFGFVITGMAVSIFDAIFMIKKESPAFGEKRKFRLMFLAGFAGFVIGTSWLGFNSIFVSSAIFLILTAKMIALHPSLWKRALASGIALMILIIPIYAFLFNVAAPDYWHAHWLLTGTKYDATVLGNIALTELLWYFAWGSMAGAGYAFASHKATLIK